jgi:hypothetical protein
LDSAISEPVIEQASICQTEWLRELTPLVLLFLIAITLATEEQAFPVRAMSLYLEEACIFKW